MNTNLDGDVSRLHHSQSDCPHCTQTEHDRWQQFTDIIMIALLLIAILACMLGIIYLFK